jgi:O-acetyl-ADP-ribose deacetylase (regulator of RNase III)
MIVFKEGNLLESNAEALVNTVNTVGIMGKGIALQFKNEFHKNYKVYQAACKSKKLQTGDLLSVEDSSLLYGDKTIINFPTKTDWRKPSEYSFIETGLRKLVLLIKEKQIKSIAIPPLGAGNGGLDWNRVKALIIDYLKDVNCDVFVYEPTKAIKDVLKKERVKFTPSRVMLLSMLYELIKNGEFVSEFASEKIAYFLQRFGAKEYFKLDFQPNFYGPYSGKVKHVLYYLNGSYITGYSSKDKKPFEELGLVMDAENEISAYLMEPENLKLKEIVENTKRFLNGYYSNFALELLSTVDFIAIEKNTYSKEIITKEIEQWSDRKKNLFANPHFIDRAILKIEKISAY